MNKKAGGNSALPWWLRPVRMMRRDYVGDFQRLMKADLNALAREARERWHVNCEWIMATPGSSPGMAQYALFNTSKFEKFPGLGEFDLLRAYLPHARKYGIRLVPYINLHWYSYACQTVPRLGANHAGWPGLWNPPSLVWQWHDILRQ